MLQLAAQQKQPRQPSRATERQRSSALAFSPPSPTQPRCTARRPPPSPIAPSGLRPSAPAPQPHPFCSALRGGIGAAPSSASQSGAGWMSAAHCHLLTPSSQTSRATEQASLDRFGSETDFDSKFPCSKFPISTLDYNLSLQYTRGPGL